MDVVSGTPSFDDGDKLLAYFKLLVGGFHDFLPPCIFTLACRSANFKKSILVHFITFHIQMQSFPVDFLQFIPYEVRKIPPGRQSKMPNKKKAA
jgi:hypothetical protein